MQKGCGMRDDEVLHVQLTVEGQDRGRARLFPLVPSAILLNYSLTT